MNNEEVSLPGLDVIDESYARGWDELELQLRDLNPACNPACNPQP